MIELTTSSDCAILTASGNCQASELLHYWYQLFTHQPPLKYQISDLSKAEQFHFDLNPQVMLELNKERLEQGPIFLAIVARHPSIYQKALLWMTFMSDYAEQIEIFNDIHSATGWIDSIRAADNKAC